METVGLAFICLMTAVALGVWVFALYDAAASDTFGPRERRLWVIFIAIFSVLGAIAYLLARRSVREHTRKHDVKNGP